MRIRVLLALLLLAATAAPAFAARVFVSTSGTDAGSCPITAPCRTFAYGINQAGPGGEMIALDTGGYGPVTVPFGVSIFAAPGSTAFIAASTTGVTVAAGVADVVTLRGLALTAQGGTIGIDFQSGQVLNVENCIINGFASMGIKLNRPGDTTKPEINVLNCVLRNNQNGIYVIDAGPGSPAGGPPPNIAFVTVANSTFTGNTSTGIFASDNSRFSVSNSVFAGNAYALYAFANQDFAYADVTLDRCQMSRNGYGVQCGTTGVAGQNTRAIVRVANCTITGNDNGVNANTDGLLYSRISNNVMTNTIEANGVNGLFTANYSAK